MAQSHSNKRRLLAIAFVLAGIAGLIAGFILLRNNLPSEPEGDAEVIKILVSEEGIYALEADDLARMGWDAVTPKELRLEHLGDPYPFLAEGNGNDLQVLFYGTPPAGEVRHYSSQNAYLLYRDGDQERRLLWQPAPANADPQAASPTINRTLRLEEDLHYRPLSEAFNTWYTVQLSAPAVWENELTVDQPAAGPVRIRADFFGVTESLTEAPDHHIRITINDETVLDQSWDGKGTTSLVSEFDPQVLVEGSNKITVEAVGDTGVLVDIVLLDSIELSFPAPPVLADRMDIFSAAGPALSLTGFSDGTILLDVEDPAAVTFWSGAVLEESGGLVDTQSGHRMAAAGQDHFLSPDTLEPAQLAPDLRSGAGADYIAIGPAELLAPLEPLLEQRRSQGLSTLAVPWGPLRDQFGAGMESPEAIRSYLAFAAGNWEAPPRYVLLVGDWTHDPKGNAGEAENNILPSMFRFTQYGGETVSDVAIAKIGDDLIPGFAIGRVPASTPEQVDTFVEKTLGYEQGSSEGWERRILAIADGQELSFAGDAERFLDQFSEAYDPVLLTPEAGATDAHLAIEQELDTGVLFMSYFGHGSIAQLGKDAIFTVEHGTALENGGRLPIMINITCLAGLFTHPQVESLSEVMLWNPEGGAVAALGATSLTLPSDQFFLTNAFTASLLDNPDGRLGEILLAAQRSLPENAGSGVLEVLDTFLLFGDPALQLPGP